MMMTRMGAGESTVDGFRVSFRSWCVDQESLSRWRNRRLPMRPACSVVQAYQRSQMLERRRPVMEAWSRHLAGESAKVVSIADCRKRP
jgi:hypothetical protein